MTLLQRDAKSFVRDVNCESKFRGVSGGDTGEREPKNVIRVPPARATISAQMEGGIERYGMRDDKHVVEQIPRDALHLRRVNDVCVRYQGRWRGCAVTI